MSLITGTGVGRYYGAQDVLKDLAFAIEPGDHIGLVGANGEGKTTLLRLLAGLETPTSGQLHRKRDLRLGYLPQDPVAETRDTALWDHMLEAFGDLRQLEAQLEAQAHRLDEADGPGEAGGHGEALERYSALQAEFERRDGYTYEHRIRTVLHGLGFSQGQYRQPLSQLSGGQRTRALLAHMLLEEADLLLLDEPTNHLDLHAVEWLEAWLRDYEGSLLVVSHDRYFLDSVTTRTWEIAFGGLETYRGNYSAYARQRQERYERRLKEWQAQQEYVAKTEDFIRRFLAGQRTKEAQGRRTRLLRYLEQDAVDRPQEHQRMHMRLDRVERSGDIALRLEGLEVGYEPGRPVLRLPELEVRRGQRVAVVGGNGTGKTTLVRTILGELAALAGQVRLGAKIELGYLPQAHDYLAPDRTVLETVQQTRPDLKPEQLRTHLGSFLFSDDDVYKRIDQLSGGERSR
ncbi:MAG: ABC-F family ATP-binding cassette domain-containing protein, partial [Gemmatimonadota bacterium]